MRGWPLTNRSVLWIAISVIFGLLPVSYHLAAIWFDPATASKIDIKLLFRDGILFVFSYTIILTTLFDFLEQPPERLRNKLPDRWMIPFVFMPLALLFVSFVGYSRNLDFQMTFLSASSATPVPHSIIPEDILLKQLVIAVLGALYALALKVRLWWFR